jgi:PAS domain S-box-containing protein
MTERQKILAVDDRKQNLVTLRRVLHGMDAEIVEATSGNEALLTTLDHHFAVALLDVMMPEMNGFELAEHLRGDEETKSIPIVFLTAADADDQLVFQGYDAGAVDYLVKPYAPEILRRKVSVFLELDRNRRALQRNLESYRTLIEQSPDAIQVMAPDGRVLQVNDAYQQLWGVGLSDLREYNIFQDEQILELGLMPAIERAFAGENVTLPLAEYRTGQSDDGRADSKRWIQAQLYCVNSEHGELLNVVMLQTDISERKRMEARLESERQQRDRERANRELAEARSEAASEFLSTMSHELRTPLNAIIGFSEMLLRRADQQPLDDYQKDRLDRIWDAGSRLLTLVNDVLDVAKVESGDMESQIDIFELSAVAQAVSGLAEGLISKNPGLRYELDLEADLPPIMSDQHKICQILTNFMGNAIKFTERGTVTLRIRRDGDGLLMSVEDTGVGIAGEHLERLFDRFYQVKQDSHPTSNGTGLGLPVCRTLADSLRGEILVQSVVGQGSTFTLSLPDAFHGQLPAPEVS